MQEIKPLGVNILVKPVVVSETTTSGIILPDSDKQEIPQEGRVVAVGEGDKINVEIKKGTDILFRQYSGDKIEKGGEEFLILDATKDVLAIVV